jgi:hypothetical protein
MKILTIMNHKFKLAIKQYLLPNKVGHHIYLYVSKIVRIIRRNLSDEEYFKKSFYENNGIELNLDQPKTFNEKLIYLNLHDHSKLKSQCADKIAVRNYVRQCGLGHLLNDIYGIYNSPEDILFDKLPGRFYVKCNHDSGCYYLYDKDKKFEKKVFIKKFYTALKNNYYYESREWQYKAIIPKIICEKVIECKDQIGLLDYRFFCIHGEVAFIAVDMGTTTQDGGHSYDARRNIYDNKFHYIDVKIKREHFDKDLIKKPENFDKMVEYAEKLAKPFIHVRVDFYNTEGKIVFGELTFCSGGGMQIIEPYEYNLFFGSKINLNDL